MIQIGTICYSDPGILSVYEMTKRSLFIMECNVRRMKYMMELGYFCGDYSDEKWVEFKKFEIELRNSHPNPEYHLNDK